MHKYKNKNVNISDNNKFGKFTINTKITNNNKNNIQYIINYGSTKISKNINILLLSGDKQKIVQVICIKRQKKFNGDNKK